MLPSNIEIIYSDGQAILDRHKLIVGSFSLRLVGVLQAHREYIRLA
jgi:hypothetical protein